MGRISKKTSTGEAHPPSHRQPGSKRVTFRDVLRVREYRWLWVAGAQSLVGDQLARVALALLVFHRTGSAIETALVYALTFVPAIVGGGLLSGLADRFPRRSVMVVCDVLRVPLLAGMAIPGTPTWLLCGLLILAVLVGAPFGAAHAAVLPQILGARGYVAGAGLRMITDQLAQVLGFGFGGAAVAILGSQWALLFDAATFLVSAVVIRLVVSSRSAALPPGHPNQRSMWHSLRSTVGLISGDARLWSVMGLGWLAAFYVVPEGVAAPYANAIGYGASGTGLLMASIPAGEVLGSLVLIRWVPERARPGLLGPMAFVTGLPLLGCFATPALAVSVVLWALSGMGAAYQIQAVASFVLAVPDEARGAAIGLAVSGLVAIQGLGVLAGGLVGDHIGMTHAVGLAGLAGSVFAIPLSIAWKRTRSGSRG